MVAMPAHANYSVPVFTLKKNIVAIAGNIKLITSSIPFNFLWELLYLTSIGLNCFSHGCDIEVQQREEQNVVYCLHNSILICKF